MQLLQYMMVVPPLENSVECCALVSCGYKEQEFTSLPGHFL